MADNFDALKNTSSSASQGFNPQLGTNTSGGSSNNHRPSYNSVWTRQSSTDVNNQVYSPSAEQSPPDTNKKFSFFNNIPKSLVKPKESYNYQTQSSYPPSNATNQVPKGSQGAYQQSQVNVVESSNQPYWEGGEEFTEEYLGEEYETEDTSGYTQEEYYTYEKPRKKKGLSFKIDRFVQRFPVLNKLYKQPPPTSPNSSGLDQQFQYDPSTPPLNPIERELTAEELALNERYTNKTSIKLINLEVNEKTQPVDVRIHHETNRIYSCDIGRSLIEIYDINGTLQHVIKNPGMLKFQPTALAVGLDATVISASHFSHYLCMYTPGDPQNSSNCYIYQQFKFGAPGTQIHEFYNPAGIAIDYVDGCLYVCDRGNCRIQVIRPEGLCERVIQLYLDIKRKHPLDPIRVALQKNANQIVCIVGEGDAICFMPKDSNGPMLVNPLQICDENGLGLQGASGLATDSQDRIYISDTGHNRIVICTPEGGFITSFGTEGDGLGQLKRPCGLDVTNDGTIVIADPGNKRLQLFGLIVEQSPVEASPSNENSTGKEEDLFENL